MNKTRERIEKPEVGPQARVMPPGHKWLQVWLLEHSEAYFHRRLTPSETASLGWWGLGLTASARRKAAKFRDCILEGRTGRASLAVAKAA